MKLQNTIVSKSWGVEIWFDNFPLYCGKSLTVHHNKWSSKGNFHYHKIKTETFFVIEGVLTLDIGDNNTGEYTRISLNQNRSYRVMPGVKHRFTSLAGTACRFIEVSTTHRESDSFRCKWNKKKKEWKEIK